MGSWNEKIEDKDLEKLKRYVESPKFKRHSKLASSKEFKEGYKDASENLSKEIYKNLGEYYGEIAALKDHYKKWGDAAGYEKGDASKIASALMKKSIEEGDADYALLGFRLYDSVNLANRKSVRRRLLKAVKTDPEKHKFEEAKNLLKYSELNRLREENPKGAREELMRQLEYMKTPEYEEKLKKQTDLESKFFNSLFVGSFIAGILLSANNLTGNFIGNSGAGNSLLGIVLILVGVGGFFVYKKLK